MHSIRHFEFEWDRSLFYSSGRDHDGYYKEKSPSMKEVRSTYSYGRHHYKECRLLQSEHKCQPTFRYCFVNISLTVDAGCTY